MAPLAPLSHAGPRLDIALFSETARHLTGASPSEFLAPAIRRFPISACAFHFVLRDAAVAVLVEPQNKLTRLVHKLAAGDLSVLVFIKVAEVRLGEGGPSPADYCEFGWIEMPIAVAIGQGK